MLILLYNVEAVGNIPEILAQLAHTYVELITNTRQEILKHVNRDRSIIDLLHMRQSGESWMTFIHDLVEAAELCQLDAIPFSRNEVSVWEPGKKVYC